MKFHNFREMRGWSLADAAEALRATGISALATIRWSMVARHERGSSFPGPDFVKGYELITDGAVTFADWMALREEVQSLPNKQLPPRITRRPKEAQV